jgi:hypothetical protein
MVIIAPTKRIPSALGGQGVLLSKLSHDERGDGSLPSIHAGCCCGGALPLQPIIDWRLRALSSFTRGPIGAPYSSLPSGKGGGLTAFTHDNPRGAVRSFRRRCHGVNDRAEEGAGSHLMPF